MSLFNCIIEYAIEKNTNIFDYEQFLDYYDQHFLDDWNHNSSQLNKTFIHNKIKSTKGLIKTYKNKRNIQVIEIKRNPIDCIEYQNGFCEKENECKYLHVCENYLTNDPFCRCRLNHNLNDYFNSRILNQLGINDLNFILLRNFYQKFYKKKNDKKEPVFHNNPNNTIKYQNQTQASKTSYLNKNKQYKIEIEYQKDIFEYSNPSLDYLLNIFYKLFMITPDDILDSRIYPEQCKVMLTFVNEKLFMNIIRNKEVYFYGMKFEINNVQDLKLIRHFRKNKLLSLILKENRNLVLNSIDNLNNFIEITKKCIIVTPKTTPVSDWYNNICSRIKYLISLFRMETINLNQWSQIEIDGLIHKITKNKLTYNLEKKKIEIVGKKQDLKNFMQSNDSFKRNSSEKFKMLTTTIDMPKIHFYGFNSLIGLALVKLKIKYNLDNYELNVKDSKIVLFGSKSNINSASESLERIFCSFKSKRIDKLSTPNILDHSNNLTQLVESCIKVNNVLNDLVYKIQVNSSSNSEESGVFISYFEDCNDLDSLNHSVYERITKHLEQNFTQIILDLTKNESMLNSGKWRQFEQETFSKSKCANNFSFCLNKNQNNKTFIYLTGKLDQVQDVQKKIDKFFKENQLATFKFRLTQIDFNYLSKCTIELKKYLDSIPLKYELKSFDTTKKNKTIQKEYFLIVYECPNNIVNSIETKIRESCSKKNIKSFQSEDLPGIDGILNSDLFKEDLESIQKEFNCAIDCKLITNNKPIFFQNNNSNKVTKSIQIDTNTLRLEIGSLIHSQVDIIVNSTSSSLSLDTGVLSKMILNVAGNQIRNECAQLYPNGILPTQIAVTSAGALTNIKNIFHISPSSYNFLTLSNFESLIESCLKKMLELNMTSIAFPSIGTGGFGYPVDLVAKKIIELTFNFIKNNSNKNLSINIVLYDQDFEAIKAYETEFSKYENSEESFLNDFDYLKKANTKSSIEFEIIYNTNLDYVNIINKIQYLISEKHIIRDVIEYSYYKEIIKNQEFDYHLNEFTDLEVKIKNDKINLFGPKEQVLDAKLKLSNLIAGNLKTHFTQLETKIRLFKHIQWEYEYQNGKWKPFSLYINSQIETAYLNKTSNIKFKNEENNDCLLDLKEMELKLENNKKFKVKRKDLKESNKSLLEIIFGPKQEKSNEFRIQYPSNWTEMGESIDFCLIDLVESSQEYLEVMKDFKSKMTHRVINKIKIQRIQNKTLYEAYLTFKKRFKLNNRNENEMLLFHGTKGPALDSICRFGFNRSYCGVNGVAYGQGVYFSNSSSYSNSYTDQYDSKIFRARVLVGNTILGNSQMKVPPSQSNGQPYDSTCDNSKSIFVCYHDNQCYPEYLISYN